MYRFECDYTEGAHPKIIEALAATNLEQTVGYGEDGHCENARRLIREACQAPDMDVHFLVGGTQTNTTVIAAILRPWQGAVCADTGHIACHETGAIEASGHKVLPIPTRDGKITAEQVRALVEAHWADATHEHQVQPGMVYISHPTEGGLLYTKAELEALRAVCDEKGLPLFLDGARLGYGLMADGTDVTLPDLARLCDVFYIGGTKVGALFGEAVCVPNKKLLPDFRYNIKQRGGMLAKGRLLGIQFETLFTDGLYFDISRHAIDEAMRLKAALRTAGCSFWNDSPTNQQFPILPDALCEKLAEDFSFSDWGRADTGRIIRFATSWATKPEATDALISALQAAQKD